MKKLEQRKTEMSRSAGIGRRNVHVHNNGIVDQMYLEKFNLYGATQGEYLKINKEYFDNATTLTMKVVTSISQINN